MSIFLTLAFLFCVGAILGWGLEVLYRSLLSPVNPEHRWVNPGFCTGPWLPLYGSGLCILFLLSDLDRYDLTGILWADRLLMLEEHDVIVRYEDVKLHIRQFRERAGKRVWFIFAFYSDIPLAEHLKAAREAWEERKESRKK